MGAHRRDSPDSPHPFSLTQATRSARFRQGTLEADLAITTPAAEVAERGDLAYLRCPIDSNGGSLPFKKTGQGVAGPAPRPWQARGPGRPALRMGTRRRAALPPARQRRPGRRQAEPGALLVDAGFAQIG